MTEVEKRYFSEVYKEPFAPDQESELDGLWRQMATELLMEGDDEKKAKTMAEFRAAAEADPEVAAWGQKVSSTHGFRSDEVAVKFLRSGSWNVEAAMEVLRSYLRSGQDYPWVVRVSIPTLLDKVWAAKLNSVCEYRDYYGRRVYIYRPGQWEPSQISCGELFAAGYVMFELIARETKTQISGVTVVADLSGFGFKHIRAFGLDELRCATGFMSGAFPLWIRKIHLVNHPRIFNIMHNMMKPLLNDRVRNNMIFHGNDVSSLHKEIPAFLLPASLGGSGELDNSAIVSALKSRNAHYVQLVEDALKNVPPAPK